MDEYVKVNEFNYSRKEFRKEFRNLFPRFQLRIRDDKDIAYFNGIKAFEVNSIDNKVKLSITPNLYVCNYSQYMLAKENSDNTYSLIDYKNDLKNIYDSMKKNYDFKFIKINYLKNFKDSLENNKIYEKCLENFLVDTVNLGEADVYVYEGGYIGKKVKGTSKKINIDSNKVVISKKRNDYTHILVNKDERYIDIQFSFMENIYDKKINDKAMIKNSGSSIFELKIDPKLKKKPMNINDFRKLIIRNNELYRGKAELEKRYQHMLLMYLNNSNDVFNFENNNKIVIPFEQEYSINGNDDSGRIDCIYYATDLKENKLTDIYFVEVKIDEAVVDGDNGVLKHLHDIKKLMDEKKLAEVVDRINYTRTSCDKSMLEYNYKECNKNFYTIFGYTNDVSKLKIKYKLKFLENEEYLADYLYDSKKEKYTNFVRTSNAEIQHRFPKEYAAFMERQSNHDDTKSFLEYKLDSKKDFRKKYDKGNVPTISYLVDKIKKEQDINCKFFFDKNKFDININIKAATINDSEDYLNEWDKFIYKKDISSIEVEKVYSNNLTFTEIDVKTDLEIIG